MEKEEFSKLLSDFLNEYGYTLYSLDYRKKSEDNYLTLILDRVDPIDLNDISAISQKVSDYLDEIDPYEESYILDVSSLGAEKPLKVEELGLYIERFINVHLKNPVDGENILQGKLISEDESSITIEMKVKTRVKEVKLEKENISKVRLALDY